MLPQMSALKQYLENQVSLGAPETIRAKMRFEREAMQNGLMIKGYRGDNVVYKSQMFQKACTDLNQSLIFSGVVACNDTLEYRDHSSPLVLGRCCYMQ